MTFVDEARISIKAGDGGKGCESFYRNKYFRYPRPNGGDGGGGGDIIFMASRSLHTLLDYRFKQHYKAERGGNASSNNKQGAEGKPYILKVPMGTIIRDADSGLLIRDLIEDKDSVVVAKGGRGGLGNADKRGPTLPESGQEKRIHLELKVIADVGIIGFPNAGKSTFISSVSRVKSKIASYPFTTKQPILGIVAIDDFHFVMADLPGIIEGAHEGRGLGDKFLKHAERTKILIHLIDMAAEEGRNPIEDFEKITHELREYSDLLETKQRIIVANKMDVPEAKENLKLFKKKYKSKIYPISAVTKDGVDALMREIQKALCKENSRDQSKK